MARPRKGEEKNAPIMFTVRVSEWVRDGFRSLAEERDVPVTEVTTEALVGYLRRNGIKAPARPRKSAGV